MAAAWEQLAASYLPFGRPRPPPRLLVFFDWLSRGGDAGWPPLAAVHLPCPPPPPLPHTHHHHHQRTHRRHQLHVGVGVGQAEPAALHWLGGARNRRCAAAGGVDEQGAAHECCIRMGGWGSGRGQVSRAGRAWDSASDRRQAWRTHATGRLGRGAGTPRRAHPRSRCPFSWMACCSASSLSNCTWQKALSRPAAWCTCGLGTGGKQSRHDRSRRRRRGRSHTHPSPAGAPCRLCVGAHLSARACAAPRPPPCRTG